MTHRVPAWLMVGLLLTTLALPGACTETNEPAPLTNDHFLAWGPHGAGVTTYTFVDTTRPTPANENYEGAPDRTLVVEVIYPTDDPGSEVPRRDAPSSAAGPFPLVVFAHGFMSGRNNHLQEAALLASHGYVVAALDFPLTNMNAPGGADFNDVMHQPGDVSFLLDELLAEHATAGSLLDGLLDDSRIALQGHSLGAFTSTLSGFHPDLRDPRVSAVILLAGSACWVPARTFDAPNVPLMIVHGDRDAIVPYEESVPALFAAATPPTWLVTLVDGTHTGFVDSTAEIFDGLTHADSVGCTALGDLDATDMSPEFTTWIEDLGGDLLAQDCALPCSDQSLMDQGMNTLRQVDLLIVSVRAFLDGLLKDDSRALDFLSDEFATTNDDVLVELGTE